MKTFKTLGKIILVVAISVILLVSVFGGIVYVWWHFESEKVFYEEKFDREKWLTAEKEYVEGYGWLTNYSCDRGKMYYDLISNHLKKGMKIQDALELLGNPEYSEYKIQYNGWFSKNTCYQYNLGDCHWLPIADLLMICYKNENVVSFVRTDINDKEIEYQK